jgi:hypothetical protein
MIFKANAKLFVASGEKARFDGAFSPEATFNISSILKIATYNVLCQYSATGLEGHLSVDAKGLTYFSACFTFSHYVFQMLTSSEMKAQKSNNCRVNKLNLL